MRIMSPPKFIMNISLIMRLIIALIVFQCAEAKGNTPLPPPHSGGAKVKSNQWTTRYTTRSKTSPRS